MAFTTASPISRVLTFCVPSDQMSTVRKPEAKTDFTAVSMRSADWAWFNEKRSIMAADSIVANGFAIPLPAMSGALPWLGSYKPWFLLFKLAYGSMPIEPVSMEASSDKISPNMLPVTTTSNFLGSFTNCMAALSTYMWSSAMSGYSL